MIRISAKDARKMGLKIPKGPKASGSEGDTKKTGGRHLRSQAHAEERQVSFRVDIPPKTKSRARSFADKGTLLNAFKAAKGDPRKFMALLEAGFMKTVTPSATRDFENVVRMVATREMARNKQALFEGPIKASLTFILAGDEGMWPTAQRDGDLDNLSKAIFDGMNGVVYKDDRLIVKMNLSKLCGENPGVEITVSAE
ncbi:RusA family crossover junction endodeoxyribonuclease [Thalassospira xianhensis]|uniref:RusA family crossover junction endodeoxyribonuclease n=1 Tax=Thalassospira xianhensis TaxID=478503 RepID=UPI000DEDEA60|nr:RusA family crossover junction endodeoxyribonuclease [Thalassospira xianhensis]